MKCFLVSLVILFALLLTDNYIMPQSYDNRIDAMTNPFWPQWLRGQKSTPAPPPKPERKPVLKQLWEMQKRKPVPQMLMSLFGGGGQVPTAVPPTVAPTEPLAPLADPPLKLGQIPVIPREFTLRQPPPTAVLSEDLGRKYEDIYAAQRAPLADADLLDTFGETLFWTEGSTDHVDHLGIGTRAFGLVDDMKLGKGATVSNNAKAQSLYKKDLKDLTTDQKLGVARGRAGDMHKGLVKELGKAYVDLPANLQLLVLDAKWNTGVTYKDLTKALTSYAKNPTPENTASVVRQSRRLSEGKPHKGLDNRAAKLLAHSGIITDPSFAKDLGLDLTDLN